MPDHNPLKLFAVFATACMLSLPTSAEEITTQDVYEGYQKNAALAQYHRWFLLYEEPRYGIENQLDILDVDVALKSSLGEAKGHNQYIERVQRIPKEWQNAHSVKDVSIDVESDGSISLSANITYLNKGALPDVGVRLADLTYTTTLRPDDSVLPKFTSIEISPNSDGTTDQFVSAYGNNRMLSLVYYWLALIEDPSRDPEPAREILAEEFVLNFSSGPIADFDAFRAWLAGPASSVKASTHKILEFSQTQTIDGTYEVTLVFSWAGILPDDQELKAKTRHTWVVVDDPTHRFAKIKSMDVQVLEPFAPKP